MQKVRLLSGNSMPLVGFGTFQIRGKQLIHDVIDNALAVGYRSFDTAAVYGNEKDIGEAFKVLLPKYKLKREDVFITSKLSPSDQGENAGAALDHSLRELGLSYLDLYLIHWPGASGLPANSTDNKVLRSQSWKALVRAKQQGKVKAIGVSNYVVKHLEELFKDNHGSKPDVNQVEWHPHYHQDDVLDLCRREGILLQAYSSLGGSNDKTLINDNTVKAIAAKNHISPAQVLLKWACQQGIGVIPKARSRSHIENNFQLDFTLPEDDMKTLANFKRIDKKAWNPDLVV